MELMENEDESKEKYSTDNEEDGTELNTDNAGGNMGADSQLVNTESKVLLEREILKLNDTTDDQMENDKKQENEKIFFSHEFCLFVLPTCTVIVASMVIFIGRKRMLKRRKLIGVSG